MAYVTRQYQAVLQCVEGRDEAAFTAAELAEDLRQAGCPVGLATVYRQLDKLESSGLVHKVPTEEGPSTSAAPTPPAGRTAFCCGASTAAASSIWTASRWRPSAAIWRTPITSASTPAGLC